MAEALLLNDTARPRETTEEDRIREVFGLLEGVPLPKVTAITLARYHAYLARNLMFPFRALYAETAYPVRHLVRYITVPRLLPLDATASHDGIYCRIEGLSRVHRAPLVDLGVLEGHPNLQFMEDFAYWFRNSW